MPPRSLTLGLVAAAALLAPLAPVRAADLDDNYGYADAPQEVPVVQSKVEFGTGWYVRGGYRGDALADPRPLDTRCGIGAADPIEAGYEIWLCGLFGRGLRLQQLLPRRRHS